jgi:hypothetical protein
LIFNKTVRLAACREIHNARGGQVCVKQSENGVVIARRRQISAGANTCVCKQRDESVARCLFGTAALTRAVEIDQENKHSRRVKEADLGGCGGPT